MPRTSRTLSPTAQIQACIKALKLPRENVNLLCLHRYGVECIDLNDEQRRDFAEFLSQWGKTP